MDQVEYQLEVTDPALKGRTGLSVPIRPGGRLRVAEALSHKGVSSIARDINSDAIGTGNRVSICTKT